MPPKPSTVLIVEDDTVTRFWLERRLSRRGYNVFTAQDGESGLNQARQHTPDVILTDIFMPGMNGTEMIKCIRSDSILNHTPILAMTAAYNYVKEEAITAGANDVFDKPLDFDLLLSKIEGLAGMSYSNQ